MKKVIIYFVILCMNFSFLTVNAGDKQGDYSSKIAAIEKKIDTYGKKVKTIHDSSNIPPEVKSKIKVLYEKTLKSLNRQKTALEELNSYESRDSLVKKSFYDDFMYERPAIVEERARKMALVEIEGEIFKLQAQLAREQKSLDENKAQLEKAYEEPAKFKENIAKYGKEIKELDNAIVELGKNKEETKLLEAERLSLVAKRDAVKAELAAVEKKTEALKERMNSSNMNLVVMNNKVQQLQELIKTWEKVKSKHQKSISFSILRESQKMLKRMAMPSWPKEGVFLKKVAERNVNLAKQIIDVQKNESSAKGALEILESRYEQITSSYNMTARRVAMLGLSKRTSKMLQARRASLQTETADPEIAAKRQNEIIEINLKNDDIIYEVQKYLKVKKNIFDKLALIEGRLRPNEYNRLTTNAYVLLESYRGLLQEASKSYSAYLEVLNKQQTTQKEVDLAASKFRSFINQRLLWAASSDFLSFSDIKSAGKAFSWLFSWENWRNAGYDIYFSIIHYGGIWLFIAILFIVALFIKCSVRIENAVQKWRRRRSIDNLSLAIALAVLKGVAVPAVLWFAMYRISKYDNKYIFTDAVVRSAILCFKTTIICTLFAEVCKLNGVGIKLFNWPEKLCIRIVQTARFIIYIIVPVMFFCLVIQFGPQSMGYRNSLGRLLFLVVMLMISAAALINLKKYKSANKKNSKRKTKYDRRNFWIYIGLIIFPIILLAISVLGYYFTAIHLFGTFWKIACFIAVLLLLKTVARLLLNSIYEKIIQNKKNNEKEAAEQSLKNSNVFEADGIKIESTITSIEDEKKHAGKMIDQILKFSAWVLGIVGVFFLLTSLFPAISMLDSVILWQNSIAQSDGAIIVETITLLELIKAIVIFSATAILVRNFSLFFEVVNLTKIKMHPGTKHAFELICKYFLIGFGFFWGLSVIGIGWAQFQYIAAAMTLGLSFGLQEIFANFVSGIIILFERPIRLGDSVNVNNCIGTVTKIRIRSTTITTFDRHEIIVPNKSFLTDKITNWSLSDKVTRVLIDVGAAYGSDTAKVEKVLIDVAERNSLVMKEPEPIVAFIGFGADSLDFQLRVFADISDLVKVQNQLRHEINRRFTEEGIEIPFAQRDIHINSSEGPLKIEMSERKNPIE